MIGTKSDDRTFDIAHPRRLLSQGVRSQGETRPGLNAGPFRPGGNRVQATPCFSLAFSLPPNRMAGKMASKNAHQTRFACVGKRTDRPGGQG